ncbi:hypothetical protein [Nocardia africana]|uniref:Uncharacterized protein n=1 Tax=Nocardia africana TaxID=134964 RepID=A0A378X448_9NOCA|nr:hypothetical protein [Nocardia africana]MCC3318359.1 hypothetical protein [Nocardia africana]SUA47421.1 Uncharacterised protein [Nocardia africana]
MEVIKSLLAQGIWPMVVFTAMVGVVTLIALMRADREDIPEIFASFAAAFGIHRRRSADDHGSDEEALPGGRDDRPMLPDGPPADNLGSPADAGPTEGDSAEETQ